MVKVGVIVGTWDSLPTPNFVKKHCLREYFGANIYQKLPISEILGGCKPTFLKPQR